MVEKSNSNPLNNLIDQLKPFQTDPTFNDCKEIIVKVLLQLEEAKKLAKPETLTIFELPSRYFAKFCRQYEDELKYNLDIAVGVFQTTLDHLENYVTAANSMMGELTQLDLSKSGKIAADSRCTLEKLGPTLEVQKVFSCSDCGLTENKVICEFCAIKCHANHNTKYVGTAKAFCDCRLASGSCLLENCCTIEITGKTFVPQLKYICKSCKMTEKGFDMLCHFCIANCHKGHAVQVIGPAKGYCDCSTLYSFCKKKL